MLRIFFSPKNPTASAGFEPANLGLPVLNVVKVSLGFSDGYVRITAGQAGPLY
jgi:hypothetical protein